jgi:pyridoxamine 5'-phosphate oxidase
LERPASLDAIAAEVWRELERAVHERAASPHPWRTPVLATTDGDSADARTVVLREVSAAQRTLGLYTDQRSPKVAQLLSHPLGTLVMWSAPLGWQLRCRVRLALEDDGLAVSSRWANVKLSPAAQDYLSPQPPGAALAAPGATPTHEAVARTNFAVIVAQVLAVDWLELHPEGHRRALFDGSGARWLQP